MNKKMKKTTNKKTIITIVGSEDWEGLYIDGKCDRQGHKIDRLELADIVIRFKGNVKIEEKWLTEEENRKANLCGYFPDNLSEMELEK